MENLLPSKCCVCDRTIGTSNPSTLQSCSCLTVICQLCAKTQFANRKGTFRSYFECPTCRHHVDANSGIIRNISTAIKYESALVDRACKFAGQTLIRGSIPNKIGKYLQIGRKYRHEGYSRFLTDLENIKDECILRLRVARMEFLREGHVQDPSFGHYKEDMQLEEEDTLPLGPLFYISFSRNILLEKALQGDEPDLSCIICRERVSCGQSTILSCECAISLCKSCAVISLAQNPATYKKWFVGESSKSMAYEQGLYCPSCRANSKFSMTKYEFAEDREKFLLGCSSTFLSQHVRRRLLLTQDAKKADLVDACSVYFAKDCTPPRYTLLPGDLSVDQLKLELARLEEYRKLGKRSPNDDLPLGPLAYLHVFNSPFAEIILEHIPADEDDLFDENAIQEMMANFQLGIPPPISHLQEGLRRRQQVEARKELNIFHDLFRKESTPCPVPNCTYNPYSQRDLEIHSKKFHVGVPSALSQLAAAQPTESVVPRKTEQNKAESNRRRSSIFDNYQIPSLDSQEILCNNESIAECERRTKTVRFADNVVRKGKATIDASGHDQATPYVPSSEIMPTSKLTTRFIVEQMRHGNFDAISTFFPDHPVITHLINENERSIAAKPSQMESVVAFYENPAEVRIEEDGIEIKNVDDTELYESYEHYPTLNISTSLLALVDEESDNDERSYAGGTCDDASLSQPSYDPPSAAQSFHSSSTLRDNIYADLDDTLAVQSATEVSERVVSRLEKSTPSLGDIATENPNFNLLRRIKLNSVYEICFDIPAKTLDESDSDALIYGDYKFFYSLLLTNRDKHLVEETCHIRLPSNKVSGWIQMVLNKRKLSHVQSALNSQLGFNAVIGQYRTMSGRQLVTSKSLSFYHLRPNAKMLIRPFDVKFRIESNYFYRNHQRKKPTKMEIAQRLVMDMERSNSKEYEKSNLRQEAQDTGIEERSTGVTTSARQSDLMQISLGTSRSAANACHSLVSRPNSDSSNASDDSEDDDSPVVHVIQKQDSVTFTPSTTLSEKKPIESSHVFNHPTPSDEVWSRSREPSVSRLPSANLQFVGEDSPGVRSGLRGSEGDETKKEIQVGDAKCSSGDRQLDVESSTCLSTYGESCQTVRHHHNQRKDTAGKRRSVRKREATLKPRREGKNEGLDTIPRTTREASISSDLSKYGPRSTNSFSGQISETKQSGGSLFHLFSTAQLISQRQMETENMIQELDASVSSPLRRETLEIGEVDESPHYNDPSNNATRYTFFDESLLQSARSKVELLLKNFEVDQPPCDEENSTI